MSRASFAAAVLGCCVLASACIACAAAPPAATSTTSTTSTTGSVGPACPRDSVVVSNRCTCVKDRAPLLGACVAPAVLDAYCGPACRRAAERCIFRTCAANEALDASGNCVSLSTVARSGPACPPSTALLVTGARATCVPPAAACPRGTTAADEVSCQAPPQCPPGSLWSGRACQAVVTKGPRGPVLDLGAWSSIALGRDQGAGSPELCRPMESAPLAFELSPVDHAELRLTVKLSVPDQDLSRVFASVAVEAAPEASDAGPRTRSLPSAAVVLARSAVATLIEPLRAFGGESSTAALALQVRCDVRRAL